MFAVSLQVSEELYIPSTLHCYTLIRRFKVKERFFLLDGCSLPGFEANAADGSVWRGEPLRLTGRAVQQANRGVSLQVLVEKLSHASHVLNGRLNLLLMVVVVYSLILFDYLGVSGS